MDVACFFPVSVYGVTCFFPVCHCGCCLFLPNVSLLFVSSSCVFVECCLFFNWASMLIDQMCFFTVILQSYCLFLHCASLWNALIVYSFMCVVVEWCLSLLIGWFDTFLHCVSFFTGCVYGVFFLSLRSVVNFFTKCLCWTLSFIFLNCLWDFFFFPTVFFKSFCCCFHLFLIFYGVFYGSLLGLPWYNCHC